MIHIQCVGVEVRGGREGEADRETQRHRGRQRERGTGAGVRGQQVGNIFREMVVG